MRFCCLALLLLLSGCSHVAKAAPQSDLTATELRFVTANAEFTLLHEMGHLLINELQLPVLGREEDAADQLGHVVENGHGRTLFVRLPGGKQR